MSHDHSIEARNMGPSIHNVIKPGIEMFPIRNRKIGGKSIAVLESQMIAPDVLALQHKTHFNSKIPPQNGISSGTWLAGNYEQHQIPSSRSLLKRVFVKYQITNASGTNVVYLPVQLFAKISIFVNNDST